MMEVALQILKLTPLEQTGTITPAQQHELDRLRQQMFAIVHGTPIKVSDPFNLLPELEADK
jgi:hypothetical protein